MSRLPTVPPQDAVLRMRKTVQIVSDRGIIVAKKWPSKRPGRKTPAQQEQMAQFKQWVSDLKSSHPLEITNAHILAINSGYTYRDVLSRASLGRMIEWDYTDGANPGAMDVQSILNQLEPENGAIIVFAGLTWYAVPIGDAGQILTIDPTELVPVWADPAPGGITELTGAVLAGPGSGEQEATLSETGVTAGHYTMATLDVGDDGRITAASSNTPAATVIAGQGTITLFSDTTQSVNPNNASENNLYSYSMPADTFTATGQIIRVRASGLCAGSSTAKTMRAYFGSVALSWTWNFSSTTRWGMELSVLRTASSAQTLNLMGWSGADGLLPAFIWKRTVATETETGAITVKLTAQLATGAASAITGEYFHVALDTP